MENEHVLGGLARLRAELTGEANILKAQLARIAGAIAQLDAVIRLFDPAYDVDGIKPKRPQAVDSAVRGDMARFVLGALREAAVPLTVAALTQRLMAERQMDSADLPRVRAFAKRVATALLGQERAGAVRAVREKPGRAVLWAIAE